MKRSAGVNISFLASIAALTGGCGPASVGAHLNADGQCISDVSGQRVDRQICTGYGHGSGGVVHGADESSGTVRGVLGGSAGDAAGDSVSAGAHAGESAGE